ncbi:DUF559 domain-containing protein [bacterium]|nr:MAG: DUF559 domain-containing protein [bacterium]
MTDLKLGRGWVALGNAIRQPLRMPRIGPKMTANARQLRREATAEERAIWHLIRDHRPKFTRQLPVGPYIVDLACRSRKIAVGERIVFLEKSRDLGVQNGTFATVTGICDDLGARGQSFSLETGQETAKTLQRFLSDVALPNLRVNFDPANMILYGNDQPIEALDLLAPYIIGVHCKDGLWPTETDQLGEEVPFGEGQVNAKAWLEKLIATGYTGPLTIEREISGDAQKRDIAAAINLIEGVLQAHATPETS